MGNVHYYAHIEDKQIAGICLNCDHRECEGICDDFRAAFRALHGIQPTRRGMSGRVEKGKWRKNQRLEAFGESHTLKEWSEITHIPYGTLYHRLYDGADIETALTTTPTGVRQPMTITAHGQTHTVKEWAWIMGINCRSLYKRIKRCGSPELAVRPERLARRKSHE